MNLAEIITKTCRKFSNKIAIREDDYALTYGQLDRKTNKISNAFRKLGIQKGDRVALYAKNSHQYIEFRLSLEKSGIVFIPINRLLSSKDVSYIMENAEVKAVVCDLDSFGTIQDIRNELSSTEWIFTIDKENAISDGERKVMSYRYINEQFENTPLEVASHLEDLCSINYTSGSTGKPKGVMLTQRNWLEVYKNMLIDREIGSDERLLHIGPLTHASGSYFMPYFMRGAENIISSKNDVVDAFFHYVEKYAITSFTCVPTMLIRIMDDPRIHTVNKDSLKTIGYGAAPMPKEQIKRAMSLFGPILVQNYGQTEAYMTVSYLSKEEHIEALEGKEERLGSIGRPYTLVNVEVIDEEGNFIENEVGELVIRSEHVMQGYWKLPKETEKTFKDGWLLTGDLAKKDEDGYLYLLGRKKELVISGGFNIYPREVEDVLYEMPEVKEAVVLGVESMEWGEKVVAFLVTNEEHLPEIKAYCKERLGFKKPKEYIVVPTLPKNATGKIDKNKLKELYQDKEGTQIG